MTFALITDNKKQKASGSQEPEASLFRMLLGLSVNLLHVCDEFENLVRVADLVVVP